MVLSRCMNRARKSSSTNDSLLQIGNFHDLSVDKVQVFLGNEGNIFEDS